MSAPRAGLAVTLAVLGGIGPICVALALLLAAGEASGLVDVGGGLWSAPVVFLGLGVAHELGHLAAIHACGGRATSVRRLGLAGVALGYQTLGRRRDVACVLAGPLAATAAGLATAAVTAGLVAATCLVIGLAHPVTLAAPTGDGRELRRLLAAA